MSVITQTGVVVSLAMVLALLAGSDGAAQSGADIPGTWAFDVVTDAGTGAAGHYSGSTLGEADLAGTEQGPLTITAIGNGTFTAKRTT